MRSTSQVCECGKPKATSQIGCDDCQRIERERIDAELPRPRLLAALRRADEWLTMSEIAERAGVDPVAASAAIARLARAGAVEAKGRGIPECRLKQRRAA